MKKYSILVLVVVLTAALFAGCGCTNRNMTPTSMPTAMPTTEASRATTEATTKPATEATTGMTTAPTNESTGASTPTIDNGNGPLEDTGTAGTGEATQGAARQASPRG